MRLHDDSGGRAVSPKNRHGSVSWADFTGALRSPVPVLIPASQDPAFARSPWNQTYLRWPGTKAKPYFPALAESVWLLDVS